jgi:beta-lactamase superfamily II metal-dependent hydrolase
MAKKQLTIEMLPAREGDCLLVTYHDGKKPRRILIDGGRKATYKALRARLEQLPAKERTFELFVITHVDRDHIEGALELLSDPERPVKFKDVWFNGYKHLIDPEATKEDFGPVQGEKLTQILLNGIWNKAFKRKAAYVKAKPITIQLDGGMSLTVISPDQDKLAKLAPVWEAECKKAGLHPTKKLPTSADGIEDFGAIDVDALAASAFSDDGAEANGSAIGLIATFGKAKVMFAADCHVDRQLASLEAISPGKKLKLSALKVAHHGSEHNISDALLKKLDCPRYLISTNGSQFKHPTRSAIARIAKHGGAAKEIIFNYRSEFTKIWDSDAMATKYGYTAVYPADKKSDGFVTVTLPA